MNTKLTAILALLVAGGGAGAYWVLHGNEKQRFALACIEEIKKRLDRPASFVLTKTDLFSREPATFATMFGLDDPLKAADAMSYSSETIAAMRALDPADYEVLSLYVVHDAEYVPGRSTHGASRCTARVSKGKTFGSDRLLEGDLMLNGFTNSEWLQKEILGLQG